MRFAKPRNSLKKVLIVAVRSCCFGALIRGLQNLDALCAVRQGHSRKAGRIAAKGGEGFNLVGANLLFWRADSRFAKPRCSLKKVLIVAVRRCHCGVLIRGLQYLEASCKGDVFRAFCVVQKEPKSTPEVCEPLDSGDDSKLCRK